MAKPIDNKDDKNPNNKKIELNSNTALMLNNIIIIIVLIVSMVIMYCMIDSSMEKKIARIANPEEQIDESDEDTDGKQDGVLLDLGDFILNLADIDKRRYLKVGIAIELTKTQAEIEAANAPAAKSSGHGHGETAAADPNLTIVNEMERYKPAIRDAVISVLSNKTSDELSTPTGKEVAKEEILEMVNGIFEGQREVQRISFGQFIIQ